MSLEEKKRKIKPELGVKLLRGIVVAEALQRELVTTPAPALELIDPGARRAWVIDYANGSPSRTINGDAGDVARSLFAVWPQGEFFPVLGQAEQISFRVDGVELALIRVLL